jgi:hypothetical protein
MGFKVLAPKIKLASDDEIWVLAIDDVDMAGFLLAPKAYIASKNLKISLRECATDVVIIVSYYDSSKIKFPEFPNILQGIDGTDTLTLRVPADKASWSYDCSDSQNQSALISSIVGDTVWDDFFTGKNPQRQTLDATNKLIDNNTESIMIQDIDDDLLFTHISRVNTNNNTITNFDIARKPKALIAIMNSWIKNHYDGTGQIVKSNENYCFTLPQLEYFKIIFHMPSNGWSEKDATCCKCGATVISKTQDPVSGISTKIVEIGLLHCTPNACPPKP